MTVWAFVILLAIPTFGGSVEVRFQTQTEEGCVKLQRVVTREMNSKYMKYQVKECHVGFADLPANPDTDLSPNPR